MELFYLTISGVLLFISLVAAKDDINLYATVIFIFSAIIFVSSLILINKPKAIDVYKGKTTLEITYKDRVPVDQQLYGKIDNLED